MIPKKRDEEARNIRTGRWKKQPIRYHERRIIVKFKAPAADSDVTLGRYGPICISGYSGRTLAAPSEGLRTRRLLCGP